MNKHQHSLLKWPLLLITLALGSVALGTGISAVGKSAFKVAKQTNEKSIRRQWANEEPFEILEYRAKGKTVPEDRSGKAFKVEGGEKWLQGLTLRIKNKSEKAIVYIRITLVFPEALVDGKKITYDYDIGHGVQAKVKRGDPILLIKGESTTWEFTEKYSNTLDRFMQKCGYRLDDLTKVDIYIQEVHFADNTMWFVGEFYVPDPDNPGGWRMIPR